ncbi:MAG TPA: hypothetical protein VN372_03415 [Methanospirillum sp.]|nr:hypothetical protein [Methanospirillum sp.]
MHESPEVRDMENHDDGVHRVIPDYCQSEVDRIWILGSIPRPWSGRGRDIMDEIHTRVCQHQEVWMRPVTGRCAVIQCPHLIWEIIGEATGFHRARRRRICSLSGKIPCFMRICPVDTFTGQGGV